MVSNTQNSLQQPARHQAAPFLILFLFVGVSVSRLLSLDAHWSSDEAGWLRQSATFITAVKAGDFSETLVAHHPGVITMWVVGLRTLVTEPHVNVQNLALGRWFIGVTVLIGLSIASILIYRLLGFWIAFISFTFIAFSPLFLAQSRRVHTDALAAVFILLVVLSLLLYCETPKKHRYLIGAGMAFGLACLAKSYSLILLLWVPVCFGLFRNRKGTWQQFFLTGLASVLCFLSCALITVFILWPIFWNPAFLILGLCLLGVTVLGYWLLQKERTQELLLYFLSVVVLGVVIGCTVRTIWRVFDKVAWALATPHEVKHFFFGQVLNDPGWLFYPLVLFIKSTPLMLPLALFGCFFLWRRQHQEEYARQFRIALGLVAVVLLFTLCLSITSKKFSRYLLPAFPILEILAAVGLFACLKWGYSYIDSRFGVETTPKKLTFSVVILLCLVLIQFLPVLRLHPHYGTYYNLCFKLVDITKIITVGEASGLDLAARYLNGKPNARELKVQISPLTAEFFDYYFTGRTYRPGISWGIPRDYEVIYIRDSQIGLVPQTGTLNGELERVITLNGVDHVWIYRIPPRAK